MSVGIASHALGHLAAELERRWVTGRGQSGMTMIETLLAVTIAAMVLLPMLGWAEFSMREQALIQGRNTEGSDLGLLRTYFVRDVTTADHATVAPQTVAVCGTAPAATPALVVVKGDRQVVYAEAAGSAPGSTSLWRTDCTTDDPAPTTRSELVTDLGIGGAQLTCATLTSDADDGNCRRVQLRLRSANGARAAITATVRSDATGAPVTAVQPPTVALTAVPTEGFRPLEVQFSSAGSAAADGAAVAVHWDFGDGTSSEQAEPTHRYDDVGSFTVTLTVTTERGGTSSDFVVVESRNNTPLALIAAPADGTTVHRGEPIAFSSTGSNDSADSTVGGRIDRYEWDFGDGTTSNAAAPTKAFDQLSPAGGFPVRLTVTDDLGAIHQAQIRVVVANRAPSVTITAAPSSGGAPLDVQLSAQVTDEVTMAVNPPLVRLWDFGDGRTSSDETPTVRYDTTGSRTVTLTVVDDDGEVAVATTTVSVGTIASGVATSGARSNFYWYNGNATNGNGQWVGYVTYRNTTNRHQYLKVAVDKVHSNGSTTTSTVNDFYVRANSSSELAVWSNDLATGNGSLDGVVRLGLRVVQLRSSDANWKPFTTETTGPTATVQRPPIPNGGS